MALKQETNLPVEVGSKPFEVERCFLSCEPLTFSKLGSALNRVGMEAFTLIHANGNRDLATAEFVQAVENFREVARQKGIDVPIGLEGERQSLIWADQLFNYLTEEYNYKLPVILAHNKIF